MIDKFVLLAEAAKVLRLGAVQYSIGAVVEHVMVS